MANVKILDSEFRNNLYKSLVEAGYDKTEAKKIVGNKYFDALKDDVASKLDRSLKNIIDGNFDFQLDATAINEALGELQKLKTILEEKKEN